MRIFALALLLAAGAGCDDGWHQGDPLDRAVTAWRLMPALDDRRVALALEPRKIHRNEQGVLTLNYETTLVGPSIAVEHDQTFATLEHGTAELRIGTTRHWMLQTELTTWDHLPPSSGPPRAPFVHATLVDRATFAMTSIPLAPAIEIPALVGDTMFDIAAGGQSDIERDIFIRRRELDGGAVTLHSGRGFASASCTRTGGVIVAYQQASGDLHVVAVAPDSTVTETTLPGVRFDPQGIACTEDAGYMAVVATTGLVVIDVAAQAIAFRANGLVGPMVVSRDGTSLVGIRPEDRKLVYTDGATARDLGLVSAKSPQTPEVTGDVALFELEAALAVVDVKSGMVGTSVPALHDYMYPYDMKRWRDKFVVQLSGYTEQTYQHELVQLYLVDFQTAAPLPLPDARYSAGLHLPGDSTLYVRGYDGLEDTALPRLAALDLATATVLSDELLPLCDDTAVLEERGCR